MEVWKPVVGFEGFYEVSNQGRVRGVERKVYHGNGTHRRQPSKILRANPEGGGYLQVGLYKDGTMVKRKIHRLVAIAFLDNAQNLPEVNHVDENKRNNTLSNLEWCTRKENENHGTKRARTAASMDYAALAQKLSKRVAQYSTDGTLIKVWDSLKAIHLALGYSQGNISMCCNGKHKNGLYGFVWRHV